MVHNTPDSPVDLLFPFLRFFPLFSPGEEGKKTSRPAFFFREKKGKNKLAREPEVECTTKKNARLEEKDHIEEKPGAD